MALIIYGGDRPTVEKQLKCKHKWHGPCLDQISRYNKCTKCFCLERDVNNLKEYYNLVRDAEEDGKTQCPHPLNQII